MKVEQIEEATTELEATGADLLSPLVKGPTSPTAVPGVAVGRVLAIVGDRHAPLIEIPGHGTAPIVARSTVDIHGAHIGKPVVLTFEDGDPRKPIILGVLRGTDPWPLESKPAQVDVDADGKRLVVTAEEQLVLRCGRASITLTKAGKVLIEGAYVSSRSSGVNRIKGGSIQLN